MRKFLFVLIVLTLFIGTAVSACFMSSVSAIKIEENEGVYHLVLDGKKLANKIEFVSSEKLISNRKAHELFDSVLTINTGYFDPKNQKTISYIIENNGQKILSPLDNENLMNNPVLVKNMDKIEARSEFRILDCGFKTKYQIASHTEEIPTGCRVTTSAQGGPAILPDLRLEEEFFIVKNSDGKVIRESASVLHRCARTIIGLKDGNIHILIFTNKHPVNMQEVQDYCKNSGLETAMGFDGGSSTSMNYGDIEVVSAKDSGRLLKSFLIVKK
ncbi:phosphodiester glycosidase family protein [bacterium]|nr:phosphodiester glycosidase family protein [bacterium]